MSNRISSMLGSQDSFRVQLTELLMKKLMRKKQDEEDENIRSLNHGDYLNHLVRELLIEVSLMSDFQLAMRKETVSALAPIWYENNYMNIGLGFMNDAQEMLDELNKQILEKGEEIVKQRSNPTIPRAMKERCSISTLPKWENKPALIVAAGPSINQHGHIKMLAERGWKGTILTTDRMLKPLLDAGVSPAHGFDIKVATVDGHRILIPRMFRNEVGNPLNAVGVDGMMVSTAAPQSYIAAKEAGVETKWFHGMMDDFDKVDGISSAQNWMVSAPAISAGGNVGATCFTLSLYLRCNPVVYIGLDLGYPADTRLEDTAYYAGFSGGGVPDSDIVKIMTYGENPDFGGAKYMQDPVFVQYKDSLLEMIRYRNEVECTFRKGAVGIYPVEVQNATEGGAVFGNYIKGRTFSAVLDEFGSG